MASKKFAYYDKGNKLAIIEEALSGNNIGKYKSPGSSIEDGLEIEYSYSPVYNFKITSSHMIDSDTGINRMFGWAVIDGYLCFVTGHNYNGGYITFNHASYDDDYADESYIYITDSKLWNGIHKVKDRQTSYIQTHTKVKGYTGSKEQLVDFATVETITINNADADKDGFFPWLSTFVAAQRSSLASDSDSFVADPQTGDYVNYYYFMCRNGTTGDVSSNNIGGQSQNRLLEASYDPATYKLNVECGVRYKTANGSSLKFDEAAFSSQSLKYCTFIGVYEDNCTMHGQKHIEVLEDEDFELDLHRNQSLAVVYHIKAKLAEDVGDLERREYFMRLFNKQIRESSSSKKTGASIVQGFSKMNRR
mgnify:CR=1 FL=1|tara:strand:- start:621 stop:1709 length:1089 start_codon:yes stop_codon:yes gene_type:complete